MKNFLSAIVKLLWPTDTSSRFKEVSVDDVRKSITAFVTTIVTLSPAILILATYLAPYISEKSAWIGGFALAFANALVAIRRLYYGDNIHVPLPPPPSVPDSTTTTIK